MLTGFLGSDWLRSNGVNGPISDTLLRAWRDDLELALRAELLIDADFAIGAKTHFKFTKRSETYTVIEIEAFARRRLDAFLDQESRKSENRKSF
ncbi:MAG TPA: hypothetical protein VGM92_02970 [Candidatus Kapabacteria bacterium]|jgi:hypothetical protein